MSIVVTGATGNLGRLVIDGLLSARIPAERIAAVVRDAEKAADIAARGVELRVADYSAPGTLGAAFAAGDRVLLISGSEIGQRVTQHQAVIDAATNAGVAVLAYTSVLGGPDADFDLAAEHKVTERAILGSGLPSVLLRNGWYHENYTESLAPVLEHGSVVASAGEGRVASASRADYAAAAVAVLTGEGHEGKTYELSGDMAWSFAEYAAELTRQSGKSITYTNVPAEQRFTMLTGAGLPEPLAAMLVDVDAAVERGLLAGTTGDLARLIGRPTTPLADAIAAALRN
ncbi:NAD(P)-dependent oxidoreductase [Streptomyces agglomeratus]|uniref:NAD(P)-dependent oxidoreductase n=1 Tax=Streptomyces agglomeratus TaxID=285458 RepID=A0A1E5PGJ8_9ACTN|nr:SDR family oxidoreductase [Streptomyces agglomeratus]OEJ28504.1 NAD(P)-dependent oxidoreductase [Streptomyces agglomeratus]OEJ37431.1 NAD(P)-dependent oxidoreductase [Streptomyces agglomeratus]OEJ48183.1 NAD(P)-dependent oxidoreductase [Streptomyces agglomeratus]OEJ49973.1 NAD(P)-dependent oxidoreductase [Streptomyces agglomeratus]OEJ57301.1 NAD(P)-dependent oxidoreductase [Streptomyces agglomeratus]